MDEIKVILIPIIFLILIVLMLRNCENMHVTNCHKKVVKSIGGCDKYGYCGVMFTDGTQGFVGHAVEGGSFCAD